MKEDEYYLELVVKAQGIARKAYPEPYDENSRIHLYQTLLKAFLEVK